MKLEWKTVEEFGGKFMVSNTGRVKSMHWGKEDLEKELIPHQDPNGYMVVSLTYNNNTYPRYVHRLVLMTFKPIDNQNEMQCDHIDNDRTNNNLSNLRWVSRKYNNGRKHARKMRSQNYYSKRHPDEFIRAEKDGETKYFINQREAADYIGCSKVAITLALSKRVEHIHKAYGWTLTYVPRSECPTLIQKVEEMKENSKPAIENKKRQEYSLAQKQLKERIRTEIMRQKEQLKKELVEKKLQAKEAKITCENLERDISRLKKQIAELELYKTRWDLHAVLQYTIEGEFVKEWKSAHEIKKEIGIDVRPAITGIKSNVLKGFIWKYKIER